MLPLARETTVTASVRRVSLRVGELTPTTRAGTRVLVCPVRSARRRSGGPAGTSVRYGGGAWREPWDENSAPKRGRNGVVVVRSPRSAPLGASGGLNHRSALRGGSCCSSVSGTTSRARRAELARRRPTRLGGGSPPRTGRRIERHAHPPRRYLDLLPRPSSHVSQ